MLRKKFIIIIIIGMIGIYSTAFAGDFKAGEILIKFKPGVVDLPFHKTEASVHEVITPMSIANLNKKHGVKAIERVFKTAGKGKILKRLKTGQLVELPDLSQIYKLILPNDADILSICNEYKKDPNVIYAEPNYIVHAFIVPNDTNYGLQWGLPKIQAEGGWDIEVGTSEVIVAVIDTGVKYDHVDLSGNIWTNTQEALNGTDDDGNGYTDDIRGWDFVNSDNNPMDDFGHGTHVAGIISAVTNNGTGVAGVSWNSKIMILKALDSSGSGYDADVLDAIYYAVSKEADVINLSLGGPYSSTYQDAIDYAYAANCVIVAAAGNDGIDIDSNKQSPVCNDGSSNEVIGVAATDQNDNRSDWDGIPSKSSNYGATYVDVSAPGTNIYSTILNSPYYGYMSGTSMSTPFVSGLAALVKSRYRNWTNAKIIRTIRESADNIDSLNPGYAGKLGTGRINAYKALSLLSYISSPKNGSKVSGTVQIIGTATGEGFSFYRVGTGEGYSPSSFVDLVSSETPVEDDVLATWNTSGLTGIYTIRLIINDLSTFEARVSVGIGFPAGVELLEPPLNGPNPFNPLKESTIIYYRLSSNAKTQLYIFDLRGNLLFKKSFQSGENGGRMGENTVPWDGITGFNEMISNGIYIYQIVGQGRVLGRGKMIVLK